MPRKSSRRAVKSLEDDEELHHEIVNHDVYVHTIDSIEEDVKFRHSTVEQDVRRWHHEPELPIRPSRSRSKKRAPSRKKSTGMSKPKRVSHIRTPKERNLSTGPDAKVNTEVEQGSQLYKQWLEHLRDPILQAYLILLIPALLYTLTNTYLR